MSVCRQQTTPAREKRVHKSTSRERRPKRFYQKRNTTTRPISKHTDICSSTTAGRAGGEESEPWCRACEQSCRRRAGCWGASKTEGVRENQRLKCVREDCGRRRNTREQLRPKQMWKTAASGVACTLQFERAQGTTTTFAGQPSTPARKAHLPNLGFLLDRQLKQREREMRREWLRGKKKGPEQGWHRRQL